MGKKDSKQKKFLGYRIVVNNGFVDIILNERGKIKKSVRISKYQLEYLEDLEPENLSEALRKAIDKAILYDYSADSLSNTTNIKNEQEKLEVIQKWKEKQFILL